MANRKVILLGKLPPPTMGPAIATQIILNSSLSTQFDLVHLDTTLNRGINTMGKAGLKKSLKSIGLYFKLFGKILRHRPKLVLVPISQTTMGFMKDAVYIWISALCFRKVVVQLRGSDFQNWQNRSSRLVRSLTRFTLKRTAGVIVLGNNLRHLFEPYYPTERIFVVPNGRNFEFPPPNPDRTELHIQYIANYLPSKGIKQVLEAVKWLKDNGVSSFRVSAAGAWDNQDYRLECEALVKEHSLPVTLGPVITGTDKWQALSDADVFIFTPNKPEGHPWVIVEALAAGLPIISSDQGAIVESVPDREVGYIVDPTDPEDIAQKLTLLLENPERRAQMGAAARKHYEQHFTEDHLVTNMARVFNTLIG